MTLLTCRQPYPSYRYDEHPACFCRRQRDDSTECPERLGNIMRYTTTALVSLQDLHFRRLA